MLIVILSEEQPVSPPGTENSTNKHYPPPLFSLLDRTRYVSQADSSYAMLLLVQVHVKAYFSQITKHFTPCGLLAWRGFLVFVC